ncbi:MFS general substrate transporter [Exidia glandulosa HHB12029]|uniref:MFS general substrate transporter n=1 Tax=Exidia glandulosa HHB12029 TaxID=1314781 RepID=A0A165BVC6_EXIGL|nr:MFS general substrate transporter [Exidia glandulosa HHB12029]
MTDYAPKTQTPSPTRVRGRSFWLVFLSLAISMYQAAFVGMALPSIAEDLHADDFVWVGSAYALASCAALPMTGGLADAFGRRYALMGSLLLFVIGSTICGAAPDMKALIAGRVVQGLGGGGILALPTIVLSDMVSLQERGTYQGILGLTWSVAIVTSAVAGGALADSGNWRWIFYLNLPITAVSITLVFAFLRSPVPPGNVREKLKKLDWIGNGIMIASTTICCVALTWAGVQYSWGSAQVLVPLIIGLLGMLAFVYYEIKFAALPLIPFHLLSNRTTIVGYIATFIAHLTVISIIYYLPVYLQACLGDSPVKAGGVHALGITLTVGPFAILSGISVKVFKKYRPVLTAGWILLLLGLGLYTTLDENSSIGAIVGRELLFGSGLGCLTATTYFPVLAPLELSANARALAFFNFLRSFGQVWGVTLGASILQNELLHRLPKTFTDTLPSGVQVAFAVIPKIKDLPEPVLSQVRKAFADSVRVIWWAIFGIAVFGGLTHILMREIPLPTHTDDNWALEGSETKQGRRERDVEMQLPPTRVIVISRET